MNWKNILNTKRNESLVLTSVILLIVMIGYINKKHISGLKDSISTIYEDRLVAKDYIFDLSQNINAKKVSLSVEHGFIQEGLDENQAIDELIQDFEQTRLTEEETTLLVKLKEDIRLSIEFENQILHNPTLPSRDLAINSLFFQYDLILSDLKALSDIQMQEGKKLLEGSSEALVFNGMASHLEIGLLVVVAMIFLMVITSPKVLIDKDLWKAKQHPQSALKS